MMSYIIRLLFIFSIFLLITFFSGYEANSSSGNSTPPEIIVLNPQKNVIGSDFSISFNIDVMQDSTDSLSLNLKTLRVTIKDRMNKAIDAFKYKYQYHLRKCCDLLKKICKLSGSVVLKEGEYLLEVKVCNTASVCERKVVRFTVLPIKLKDSITTGNCGSKDDPDNDCVPNIKGDDNCPERSNPDQADWNGDGVGDVCQDSDGDGMRDDDEIFFGTDPGSADTDRDGLSDDDEFRFHLDPNNWDTNGDCKSDLEQVISGPGCAPKGGIRFSPQKLFPLP